jgi:hypothetical protein
VQRHGCDKLSAEHGGCDSEERRFDPWRSEVGSDWLASRINAMELHASDGTLRITDAVSGHLLLFAVGPGDYRFGERR